MCQITGRLAENADNAAKNHAPGQAGKKQHEESRCHDQGGGAQIGLFQNQGDRQNDQYTGDKVVPPAQAELIFLKEPGDHHRQRDLHDLRRLNPGEAQR